MTATLRGLPNEKYLCALAGLDPQLSPDSLGFAAAVVLLAAYEVGTSQYRLVHETGYPRDVVRPLVERYRQNGIFRTDGQPTPLSDDLEFWAFTCCGEGLIERAWPKRKRGRPVRRP